MSVFCTTTSFQSFNSVDVWIGLFLCKMSLLRTLQFQWSSCWSGISGMLESSAVFSLQPGLPDYLILVRVTSRVAVGYLKDVVSSIPTAHLAKLKARIAQHILNVTPRHCYQLCWICSFSIWTSCRKRCTTHIQYKLNMFCTSLAKFKNQSDAFYAVLASRQLKTDMMDAFYTVFGLRIVKNLYDECFLCGFWSQNN